MPSFYMHSFRDISVNHVPGLNCQPCPRSIPELSPGRQSWAKFGETYLVPEGRLNPFFARFSCPSGTNHGCYLLPRPFMELSLSPDSSAYS
jgi:hypothetical protein